MGNGSEFKDVDVDVDEEDIGAEDVEDEDVELEGVVEEKDEEAAAGVVVDVADAWAA